MTTQQYKKLYKLVEYLQIIRPFDKLKKMFTFLLIAFFIIALTVAAESFFGVKAPGYQQGSEDGYRAGYHTGFDGNIYSVTDGLSEDRSYDSIYTQGYDKGYIHGYDEGYPAGQSDRESSQQLKAGQELEVSQERENEVPHNFESIISNNSLNRSTIPSQVSAHTAAETHTKMPDLNDSLSPFNTVVAFVGTYITYKAYELQKKNK